MDTLLFVRQSAHFESMDLPRLDDVCGLESSPRSWLWSSRGDRAPRIPRGHECVVMLE
jgi:hypothetical protein